MQFTEEQRNIIELNNGQHLVLAPPGTGKTELLVQRLSNAIQNGISQDKMICLTFTNRAAQNMMERVEKDIGNHDIFIGNIHSFCNTFLRKNNLIPQNVSLLDEEDVQLLFNEIKIQNIANSEGKDPSEVKCWVYDKYKSGDNSIREITASELLSYNTYIKQNKYNFPEDIIQKVGLSFMTASEDIAYQMCQKYEKIKEESNFIDFDDLLTLTYHYFQKSIDTDTLYEWIQIDEVQDLNPLQWAIINKISNPQQSHRVFFGDYEL